MAGERALPGLGLRGFYTAHSDGWGDTISADLRVVSVLLAGAVKSRTTALPGSPTDGDIYIVPSGGDANKVAVRDNGAWIYLDPAEGWRLWVKDEDVTVIYTGATWVVVGSIKGRFHAHQSGVTVDHTGTTAETVLATIAMPALGVNDGWEQELSFECTGSTNSKVFRVRLGNISGASVLSYTVTTASVVRVADLRSIYNKAATNAQTVTQANGSLGYTTSSGSVNDTVFDTSVPFDIVITAQLGLSSEHILLKSSRVEVLRG